MKINSFNLPVIIFMVFKTLSTLKALRADKFVDVPVLTAFKIIVTQDIIKITKSKTFQGSRM